MGRDVPEYPEEDQHETLLKPWRIIYRITHRVEIITVHHYRKPLPTDSQSLTGTNESDE